MTTKLYKITDTINKIVINFVKFLKFGILYIVMSKKLTIALDEKQYAWVGKNGNASYAIRELIDADMKKQGVKSK